VRSHTKEQQSQYGTAERKCSQETINKMRNPNKRLRKITMSNIFSTINRQPSRAFQILLFR
jgi:hypothetical protein